MIINIPKPMYSYEHSIIDGVEYKYCTLCNSWKTLDSFCSCKNNKDKLHSRCKQCAINTTKQYRANLTEEQKEQIKKKDMERYYNRTPEQVEHDRQLNAKYRANLSDKQKEIIRERIRLAGIKYRANLTEEQRKQIRLDDKERYIKNILNKRMACGIRYALQDKKAERHWENFVPYNFQQLKQYLNIHDNFKCLGYELDHIIPQSLFKNKINNNSTTRAFQICWSLLNLRLIPTLDNRKRPKDCSDVPIDTICSILFQYIPKEYTNNTDTNTLGAVIDSLECDYYLSKRINLKQIVLDYYNNNRYKCFNMEGDSNES